MAMAFDIMALVCMDLRYLLGKLHVLEWARDAYRFIGCSALHLTAALAFVDGVRYAQGLGQMNFFAGPEGLERDTKGSEEPAEPPISLTYEERGRRMEAVQPRAEEFTLDGLSAFCQTTDFIAQDLIDGWAAFDKFSNERLGVPAEVLLKACGFPFLEPLKATLRRYKNLTPAVQRAAELCACITASWDKRFAQR